METNLVPPHMDKNWSFQVSESESPFEIPSEIRETVLIMIRTPIVQRAKPFLQSDCLGFLMVEFWTDDENAILQAWHTLENSLK